MAYKYVTEQDVYNRCGLTISEVNLTTNTNIINDSEAEVELITGRKFTNGNAVTEYLNGPKVDILSYAGQKAKTITISNYPIQSITGFSTLNTDGTILKTYANLSGAQIIAGTFDTVDYWLNTIEDQMTNVVIPFGKITMKTDEFMPGISNIKVTYTYGYSSVPADIRSLVSCIAGVRMWIQFLGGKYNRLDSYSIPQQTANKGDLFLRGERMINQLTQEAERLYLRIGKKARTMLFSSGLDR